MVSGLLFRLAYLGVTNALALLQLLPMSDRDKDAEILALVTVTIPTDKLATAPAATTAR